MTFASIIKLSLLIGQAINKVFEVFLKLIRIYDRLERVCFINEIFITWYCCGY